MADTALHSMTEETTPAVTDEMYLLKSPFSSGLDRRMTISNLMKTMSRETIGGNTGTTTIAAGQTRYVGVAHMSATESDVYVPFAIAGTVRNLRVYVAGSPGAGQTYTCTLRKTLANTTLTCTITEGNNTASDTTHTATVAAGDRWALMIVASASAATTNVSLAFEFVPD